MRLVLAAIGLIIPCLLLDARAEETPPLSPPPNEAKLFDALDLSLPGLAGVKTAWDRRDIDEAKHAFAAYLRTRTTVRWGDPSSASPKPLSAEEKRTADDAVEGRVQGGLVPLVYPFPGGDIDWHFNATEHVPGQTPNNEWQWQLNRMAFWGCLADAYRATGDEKYARAFARQARSWIAQCPVPDRLGNDGGSSRNGAGSAWRTIEAGIRMSWAWPAPFFAFLHSPSLTDDDLTALAGSFLDHGRYLRSFNTRMNFLTMEMSGLYSAGTIFPEFREAAEWRAYATQRLAEEAHRQFLPDGAQMELSTGYQNVALGNILQIARVAHWNGREAELPAGYAEPLEKDYEWQLSMMAPDRFLPKFNDSWPASVQDVLKKVSALFPSRADFRWIASDGAEGSPPSWTSAFLDWSGFAVMRSGWERDANYLVFRVGPLGAGHMHQSALEVMIWPYGRELLFDGGGGSYEKSKWRAWATSTYAANCVIVDGLPQNRAQKEGEPSADSNRVSQQPIDARWTSTPACDFASGSYDFGYGPKRLRLAAQRRDVLFLKPDLYVVADRLVPADAAPHTYQARWQLLTTRTKIDPKTRALVTGDPNASNLAVVPLRTDGLAVASASAQEDPEILGWNIRKDLVPQNVPATTLLHTRTGTGPQSFLTLFVPLRPSQANPVANVESGPDGTLVSLADGRRLRISATDSGISVRETLANGAPGRVTGQ